MTEIEKLRKEATALSNRIRDLERRIAELSEGVKRHRMATYLAFDRVYKCEVTEDGDLRMAEEVVGRTEDVTGFSPEFWKFSGEWRKVVHPDCWIRVEEGVKQLLAGESCEFEVCLIARGRPKTWHSFLGVPEVEHSTGRTKGGTFFVKDITDRKRTEEEMLRLESMRALGQLAAGISHNLNNILTTIIGPARLLEDAVDDQDLRWETQFIIRSAMRASDLVKKLNLVAKGGSVEDVEAVPVNTVVEEAVDLARQSLEGESQDREVRVDIVTKLGEGGAVWASKAGLADVVMNLLLNAADALPEGGTIVVRTEREGEGIAVSVKDDGLGMTEQVKERIFEPFFTTKRELGTGLGLSTVLAAVTTWGGRIDVESAPGEGSEFRVWLPAAAPLALEQVEAVPAEVVGRGKVMVVDDVREVREFVERVLSRMHEVVLYASAAEVLEFFEPGQYDAALIDLGMPGMPGDRLARLLKKKDPALSTVLMSGWALGADDPRTEGFDFRIAKPFRGAGDLARVVAEAIRLHDARTRDAE